jgi:hypothetical protein
MRAILRSLGAVLLGAVAATLLVLAIETVGHLVFPPPAGLDLNDPEQRRTFMAQLPLGAFVFVLVGWGIGTLAGSWLAARVAGQAPLVHGLVVGALFLLTAIATMLMLPHPLWFWITALFLFPLSSGVGVLLAPDRKLQPGGG